MAEIRENQELHMTNVLSMRKRVTAQDLQQEMERIGHFVKSNGLRRIGPKVTATFAVAMENGRQIMDVEVLIPLDRPFDPPEGCVYKPLFRLVNAVTIQHIGNPATLQDTYNTLLAYIQEHQLQAITPGYNVAVQEVETPDKIDQLIVDVYIGVSHNIL